MTSQPQREDLIDIARGAGEILRQGYGKRHDLGSKSSDIDLVTEIDHQSEKYLLEALGHRYPDQRVVSEESDGLAGSGEGVFYIDPVDGTVNYAHGLPIFSVSLAYAVSDEVQLGVVYDPTRDEVFSAERGKGAWLNNVPLQVSTVQDLRNCLLATGFPYDRWTNPNNNIDNYTKLMLRSQGVQCLGSATIDLCYIGAGRLDGCWEPNLGPWDVAAGSLIATEAGARVTTMDGGEDLLSPPFSVVAANPQVHAQMLDVLQSDSE
ncbi:MAG: inositol monophosphatase [Chloroflexi bacterium]|nr:MAG: inositol monophosphatase [Chloroflexota bacterium]MBL1197472.1 inositol monophosphatase [Chloroflexota bacterium]NOH14767.1 inositol monophosphatase [Chloroflexota bacterium]